MNNVSALLLSFACAAFLVSPPVGHPRLRRRRIRCFASRFFFCSSALSAEPLAFAAVCAVGHSFFAGAPGVAWAARCCCVGLPGLHFVLLAWLATVARAPPSLRMPAVWAGPLLLGSGPAGYALKQSGSRLRYDAVVEDDFALAVPDDIRQVGVAGDDLRRNSTCKESRPAQDDKTPVQRCAEEFFHEPEGMS